MEVLSSNRVNSDPVLFGRQERPFGKSWEEWTIEWWQWLLSMPKEISPAIDKTGRKFNLETQDKDCEVIFLAGNLGGYTERTYVIPAGKALLFPIINYSTSYSEEPQLKTEADLVQRATKDIDDIVEKMAMVDGHPIQGIENYRVQAPPFEVTLIRDNIFDVVPGITTASSDGYWIFLKPLSIGDHEIHTRGSCSLGKTCVDSKLHLVVK
jgi:hypothetical protein